VIDELTTSGVITCPDSLRRGAVQAQASALIREQPTIPVTDLVGLAMGQLGCRLTKKVPT
jgi:hypothetical protein